MLGRILLAVWPTQNLQEKVSEHLAVCWDGLCPKMRKGRCKIFPAIPQGIRIILGRLHLGLGTLLGGCGVHPALLLDPRQGLLKDLVGLVYPNLILPSTPQPPSVPYYLE